MSKFRKKEYIIAHLLVVGHISSFEAISKYRHTRLSTVIHELRHAGAAIRTVDERHVGGSHARYHVIDPSTIRNALSPKMLINVDTLMSAANDPDY